jgi:N-carbamoyl-L-amino-acid hydrolase
MKINDRLEVLGQIRPRLSGTAEDKEGKNLIVQWMLEDGLAVTMDEFGNIIGRLDGEGDPIVTGSHTDTVATAGKYDGALGVLAGLEAARILRGQIKSPLEVVIFDDEENTMGGSLGYVTKNKPKAFIELHVEQGPILDSQHLDIGVVQGIVGQRRCHITIHGQANHAGTTPMNMRDDALVTAASLITYVNDFANEMYDGLVATVGELTVSPNAFSVIPGQVDLTLQVRDLSAMNMEMFVDKVSKEFDLRIDIAHTSEPALCDSSIMNHISEACDGLHLKYTELPSRASHDAQCFTDCPMGMIFVPSVGGLSHSEDEFTSEEHCLAGTRVLVETIRRIDYN